MLDPDDIHVEPDHQLRSHPTIKGEQMSVSMFMFFSFSQLYFACSVEKVPYKFLDKCDILRKIVEQQKDLLQTLKLNILTLYEVWEWFVSRIGYDCDIEVSKCCNYLMLCGL